MKIQLEPADFVAIKEHEQIFLGQLVRIDGEMAVVDHFPILECFWRKGIRVVVVQEGVAHEQVEVEASSLVRWDSRKVEEVTR